MNILVLGSGGREHALLHGISQSLLCKQLYAAPGNAGTQSVAENVNLDISNFSEVGNFCLDKHIDIVVVGPEAPLVDGISDYFALEPRLKNVNLVGPSKLAAQLEGSKDFAKAFMQRNNIPTAGYQSFESHQIEEAKEFLKKMKPPYVLKADGLAAGKGVLIIDDLHEAESEVENMLQGKFGDASRKLVIEEFLSGREFSAFAFTDGESYALLPMAKDYKRIGEGDTGLNTGGMGAVSPVPFVDEALEQKVISRVVEPTISGLKKAELPYFGFVFFGLIEVKGDPFVIEYNVRMGDPETEVVIPRVKSDLVELFKMGSEGNLKDYQMQFDEQHASTVMTVSKGYPEAYDKGKAIAGLDNIQDAYAYHAGTKLQDNQVLTNGGRVLALTAKGHSLTEALEKSYRAVKTICFEGIEYRSDIGKDVL